MSDDTKYQITQVAVSYDRKISDGNYGSIGGFLSVTANVENGTDPAEVIRELFAFVREQAAINLKPAFREIVHRPAAREMQTEQTINIETPIAVPTGVTTAPPIVVAAPAQAQAGQTINAVKMSVTPRADGKVEVKWFAAGHTYPDIYATKTVEALCDLLKATGQWTPAHFGAVAEYLVPMTIRYVNSEKLNSKGNPYKNIVAVLAASASNGEEGHYPGENDSSRRVRDDDLPF